MGFVLRQVVYTRLPRTALFQEKYGQGVDTMACLHIHLSLVMCKSTQDELKVHEQNNHAAVTILRDETAALLSEVLRELDLTCEGRPCHEHIVAWSLQGMNSQFLLFALMTTALLPAVVRSR